MLFTKLMSLLLGNALERINFFNDLLSFAVENNIRRWLRGPVAKIFVYQINSLDKNN